MIILRGGFVAKFYGQDALLMATSTFSVSTSTPVVEWVNSHFLLVVWHQQFNCIIPKTQNMLSFYNLLFHIFLHLAHADSHKQSTNV